MKPTTVETWIKYIKEDFSFDFEQDLRIAVADEICILFNEDYFNNLDNDFLVRDVCNGPGYTLTLDDFYLYGAFSDEEEQECKEKIEEHIVSFINHLREITLTMVQEPTEEFVYEVHKFVDCMGFKSLLGIIPVGRMTKKVLTLAISIFLLEEKDKLAWEYVPETMLDRFLTTVDKSIRTIINIDGDKLRKRQDLDIYIEEVYSDGFNLVNTEIKAIAEEAIKHPELCREPETAIEWNKWNTLEYSVVQTRIDAIKSRKHDSYENLDTLPRIPQIDTLQYSYSNARTDLERTVCNLLEIIYKVYL